ncbi:aldehyde dehydrogenase [Sporanaerobium hydrogeniformans]|uniref:Aldehyde dehydrogenase n=1 Tax=Sporanaerobium hydrogeniformans TaxID=3072179 RepID=A0AC61DCY8_9FIRM|nr:aldehyde dehydrogenase family protein [Sporanaerobium hydrogeniformans]PHV70660.1 aldehyde dehydrogenase [Sporanaerobium hydrogeniformans]
MQNLSEKIQQMHYFFYKRKTYDIDFRLKHLRELKKQILVHQDEIAKALYKDFKKPAFETYLTEIYTVVAELNHITKSLKSWAKPTLKPGVLPLLKSSLRIYKEPYGVCLIYAPFNYPFQLALTPLVGAIAAGNCCILKPSEHTPATNKIIRKILRQVFPSYYVCVVEGDAQISHQLLEHPLDYVFFTGGTQTAKKIMEKVSQSLVPVTLELGGKSPVIVDYDANIPLAAKRILWGKFLNAGQTCVAPDYVLVHENCAQKLLFAMTALLKKTYHDPKKMTRIINEASYVRLLQLIDEEKIYYGGHFNTDDLYIEPTLLYPVSPSDACMQEEIFGPILPIIPFKSLEGALRLIERYPKPLACYLFGEDKRRLRYWLKHLSFGGGCINDTLLHLTSSRVPFGGVGYSGMGQYHGYWSFQTFSHEKTILTSSPYELPLRYPPYTNKLPVIKKLIR